MTFLCLLLALCKPDPLPANAWGPSPIAGARNPAAVRYLDDRRLWPDAATRGNVYYVAKDGDDDGLGTEAEPWHTIQHAANLLQAGDTLYIKEGIYQERAFPQNSGVDGGMIHYTAYPGHEGRVVIDGAGIQFSSGGLFHVKDKSYIMVSNLRVENSDEAAILVSHSDHIILTQNQTRDSHSSGIGVWRSANVLVDHNTVINARNVPLDQGGHEECITVSGTTTFEVRYNEVYHQDVATNHLVPGIDVKGSSSNGKIYGNYVHDMPPGPAIYIDAWDAHNHDHQVFQNLLRDAGGISVGSERGGTAENITIYNNLLIRPSWTGIKISKTGDGQGGNGWRVNVKIFNNTIYGARGGHGGAGIYVMSEKVENIQIKNNVVSFGWGNYGPEGWDQGWVGQITAGSPSILARISADKNVVFGPQKCAQDFPDCRAVPNSLKADPLFADRAGEDFHLSLDSPAIDIGVDLGAEGVTDDFDGLSRPQGSGFEVGAFEYADPSQAIFADVPAGHPYHDAIEALYRAGYTAGCGANPLRYCPDQALSRAESAVFVQRGAHGVDLQPEQPSSQTFADLPLESWAAKWAEALYVDGFTVGCGTDPLRYCPWQGHTRAEGATFYLRMLHGADYIPPEPEGIFSDVPPGAWYAKWAEAAYGAGLIPACSQPGEPLRFCPDDPLSRGLAAFMMVRAKGLPSP